MSTRKPKPEQIVNHLQKMELYRYIVSPLWSRSV